MSRSGKVEPERHRYVAVTQSDVPFEQTTHVGGRHTRLPNAVLESRGYRGLSGNAAKVLIHLYYHCSSSHNDNQVWPGTARLARETGLSLDMVYRAEREIVASGLAKKLARGYRFKGEVWQLLTPPESGTSARNIPPESGTGARFSTGEFGIDPKMRENLAPVRTELEPDERTRTTSGSTRQAQSSGSRPNEPDDGARARLNQTTDETTAIDAFLDGLEPDELLAAKEAVVSASPQCADVLRRSDPTKGKLLRMLIYRLLTTGVAS